MSSNHKYFLMSMFISSLILLFFMGIEIAEYNMRKMIIDDNMPFFEYDISSDRKSIGFMLFGNFIKLFF